MHALMSLQPSLIVRPSVLSLSAVMSLPVGLANLGASCFINASLQSLLAVPALRAAIATGTEPLETALGSVLRKLESRRGPVMPTEITSLFYRGHQEDAAEFLVVLFSECPALHPCLRGLEIPLLRCQHCSYERSMHPEEFLTLQLTLVAETLLSSVQEALDHYLSYTELRRDFRDWCCTNPECISAEKALDPPVAQSKIRRWPEVLSMNLKRWDGIHSVVGHKIHCNDTVVLGGTVYRLQSLVTHIGRRASSGHYVAYVRQEDGFVRLSDTAVTRVDPRLLGDFVSLPDEKVYMLFYVATAEVPLPDAALRQEMVVLDSDSDSDVIVQQDKRPAEHKPANENLNKKLRTDSETQEKDQADGERRPDDHEGGPDSKKARVDFYTPEKIQRVAVVLRSSDTLAIALKQLRTEMHGFTTTDKTAAGYMSRDTLRYQFEHPESKRQASGSWQTEKTKYFKVFQEAPCARSLEAPTTKAAEWTQTVSWVFCPHCGRHRPRPATARGTGNMSCKPACDPSPQALLEPGNAEAKRKLMAYITPQSKDWDLLLAAMKAESLAAALSPEDLDSLVVIKLYVDCKMVRGGKSEVTSMKKLSVVRAEWRDRPLQELPRSSRAAAAFDWLLRNNTTYKSFVDDHTDLCNAHAQDRDSKWKQIRTANLLLQQPGIEVAVRPWLYPWASYGDSDINLRLKPLHLIKDNAKPSLRASWERKTTSRCVSYAGDFKLQCLLYDIAMARTISTVATLAASKQMAPEAVAADMDMFEAYWQNQIHKMEDICRLEFERHESMEHAMPSVFFTVAPAEWTFPLHEGVFLEESLSKQQTIVTRHMHHVLDVLLHEYLLKEGPHREQVGIASIRQWSFRYEFQSRGTLHLHGVLWADLLPGVEPQMLTGRTGEKHCSALVTHLEQLFHCRVDVQAGAGKHNLMRYVMGYVQKASDALSFKTAEARGQNVPEQSTWRTTYRLLCKKAPLEQEMALEFAGLNMVRHSFLGATYFAPIPGSAATNVSRAAYNAYQDGVRQGLYAGCSFLAWLRDHRIEPTGNNTCKVFPRTARSKGSGHNKDVGVAIHFPFELLDIFLGAWAATFLVGMDERRLMPETPQDYPSGFSMELRRRQAFEAPEGCRHLKAVLCLDEFQQNGESTEFEPDVNKLVQAIEQDLIIRGLNADRLATFKARLNACALLLKTVYQKKADAVEWSARRIFDLPRRVWSPQQQQVLDAIFEGTHIADAQVIRDSNRLLHVTGGPGTGKTEVIIAAAQQAIEDGCRVLIAGPIGLLVSLYRTRLPPSPNLTMETLHASFKVTRTADEQYVPPGRLRRYDLIIFDEISQIDAHVWRILQTALAELYPNPFVVFVGDFQQLQPIVGVHQLQLDLERQTAADLLPTIELQPHAAARSTDPVMLNFLNSARLAQPSRSMLESFFDGRQFPQNAADAARQAREIQQHTGRQLTFLTVTNRGAAALNMHCLFLDFPAAATALRKGAGYPADTAFGQDKILIEVGMRVRLTRNLDKDRGFVNGNLGMVHLKIRPDVFVVKTIQDVLILVHPITLKGYKFIPVCYAYATTIRRAQGASLPSACLCFDKRRPDRGYAYVGASRVSHHSNLFHMGNIRRTDWLPVNGDPNNEQLVPGPLSESSDSEEEHQPTDSSSTPEPEEEDLSYSDGSTDPHYTDDSRDTSS